MHDKVMECPKCHGSAEASGGSDEGIHYLCLKCGCAFVFDIKTLKTTVEQDSREA